MKFFELDLSDGRKITKGHWDEDNFLFLKDGILTFKSGTEYGGGVHGTDWVYFVEPVEKKSVKLYAYANKDLIKEKFLYELQYSISDNIKNERYFRLPEFDKKFEV